MKPSALTNDRDTKSHESQGVTKKRCETPARADVANSCKFPVQRPDALIGAW